MKRAVLVAVVALAACGGEKEEGAPPAVKAPDPAQGRKVYEQAGCSGCHTFSGFPGPGRNTGPNLDRVAEKYDAAFIRRSITNPGEFLEKGSEGKIGGARSYSNTMPAYGPDELPPQQLSEQQLRDLVAFIEEGGSP